MIPSARQFQFAFPESGKTETACRHCLYKNNNIPCTGSNNKFVLHSLPATWFHSSPEKKRSGGGSSLSSHRHTAANTFAPVGRAARGDAYIMGHLRQKLITLCVSVTHSLFFRGVLRMCTWSGVFIVGILESFRIHLKVLVSWIFENFCFSFAFYQCLCIILAVYCQDDEIILFNFFLVKGFRIYFLMDFLSNFADVALVKSLSVSGLISSFPNYFFVNQKVD